MARLHTLFSEDDPAILDFQLAVTLRLKEYDTKRDRDFARTIGLATGKSFVGEEVKFIDEEEDDFITV